VLRREERRCLRKDEREVSRAVFSTSFFFSLFFSLLFFFSLDAGECQAAVFERYECHILLIYIYIYMLHMLIYIIVKAYMVRAI